MDCVGNGGHTGDCDGGRWMPRGIDVGNDVDPKMMLSRPPCDQTTLRTREREIVTDEKCVRR